MWRKGILLCVLLALLQGCQAIAAQYAFEITFSNKNNTPYSLSSPNFYLSSRALLRRTTQGIAIDSTDLPVNPDYVDSVLTLTGGIFHETSRWLNMCIILLPAADSAMILQLAGKPFIRSIRMVGHYGSDVHNRISGNHTVTGNPAASHKTTSDATYYGVTFPQTQLVAGNYLHDYGYNGEGKLIAILDAGFIGANTHAGFDSMWSSGRVLDTFNFTYHCTNVFFQDSHGTNCLSVMAGYVPDTFVGSAPLASYALYVTEYEGDNTDQTLELDNLLAATERADSLGADVISESLGYDLLVDNYGHNYGQTFDSLDGKTTVAALAANIATKKGMLFVATAGNDGTPPIAGWGTHILTPGDADSALTIGAVSYAGAVQSFSGYGPNAAGRIKPDVCGEGAATWNFNATGGYETQDGTSLSTPGIAGWATCLWQAVPAATPYQIRQAIIKCASNYTLTLPSDQLGYGVPNFQCTGEMLNVIDTPVPVAPASWVMATPSPFANKLNVSVYPDVAGNVSLNMTDMAGNEVMSLTKYQSKGFNAAITISLPELPMGVYILKAISAHQQKVMKLVKQ